MATKTDKQVQDLFKIVQIKKSEIAKAEKPNWQTNCSFGYSKDSGARTNIQTVSNVDELIDILAFIIDRSKAHTYACDALSVKESEHPFKWMGFSLDDWKTDILTRLNKIQISKKKQELEALESRLDKLVSPELKAEMELEEITKLLQ